MNEFKNIAFVLQRIIKDHQLFRQHKAQFGQKINYQVNKLYQKLQTTKFNFINHLLKELSFIYQKSINQSFSSQNLCVYLGISIYHIKRNYSVYPINDAEIYDLERLVRKDIQIFNSIKNILGSLNIERLFQQIDFFSNGYIDYSNLGQFFKHYIGQLTIDEKDLQSFIQLLKGSQSADKIYIQDLEDFMKTNINQNFKSKIQIITEVLSQKKLFDQNLVPIDLQISEIKQKYHALHKIDEEKSFGVNIISEGKRMSIDTLYFEKPKLFEKSQNFSNLNPYCSLNVSSASVEERLVRNHSRNQKYFKNIKRQRNLQQLTMCNLQKIPSVNFINSLFETKKTELTFRLRQLSQNYSNRQIQLMNLIEKNQKFSFLNGFNVIDQHQNQIVIREDFEDFLVDSQIQISQKRISTFFNKFSKQGIMKYCDYLRIFQLKIAKKIVNQCKKRKPLITEKWSDNLKEDYGKFFSKILQLIDEQSQIKDQLARLLKNQESFENISLLLFSDEYVDRQIIAKLIGFKCDPFLDQIFGQQIGIKGIQWLQRIMK